MEGWIKLHRKMVNWEWYTDDIVKVIFLHLLLCANHKPNRWRGIEVGAGELITSYKHLSEQTGHSVQEVRTAISKLKMTGEITVESTNKYSLISLVNYRVYQDWDDKEQQTKNTQIDEQSTRRHQTNNNQSTTNNNDNNYKNDNNDKNNKYGDFKNVILSDEEYEKLNNLGLIHLIDELSRYIASTGKNYASHYATLLSWSEKRKKETKPGRLSASPSFDIKKIEYEAMFNEGYDV